MSKLVFVLVPCFVNRPAVRAEYLKTNRLVPLVLLLSCSASAAAHCIVCLSTLQLNRLNSLGNGHLLHLSLVILYLLRLIKLWVLPRGLSQDISRSLAWLNLSECDSIDLNIITSICDKISR